MPYTKKEKNLYTALVKQYGAEKAKRIYHAMAHSQKYTKVFSKKTLRRTKRSK